MTLLIVDSRPQFTTLLARVILFMNFFIKFPIIISGYDSNMQNINNIDEYIYWELHETIGPLNEFSKDGNPKININNYKIEKCNITEMYPKDYGELNYDGLTLLCPSFSNNKDAYIQDPIYSQKSLSYIIKIFNFA